MASKASSWTWELNIMTYKVQRAMQGGNLRKGTWLQEEDEQLTSFVTRLGDRRWDSLAKVAGLSRSGKSCRLRWMNYLRPNLKHGPFSVEEEQLIIQLQQQLGNKWSKIARRLPGRTDNEIKNYWKTHLRRRTQVQLEGEFKNEIETATQDFNQKSIDMISKDYNYNHVNNDYCEDHSEGETKDSSTDTFPLTDWELRRSPYETRLLDWISDLQNGYGEKDCNSIGTYDYVPQEFAGDYDTWDYSDSLWHMNYI